ncbi:MAG: hypothetical protein ABIS69_08040 [Sediminibacterium sp.]
MQTLTGSVLNIRQSNNIQLNNVLVKNVLLRTNTLHPKEVLLLAIIKM